MDSRVTLRWTVLVTLAAVFLAIGAGVTYVGLRSVQGEPVADAGDAAQPAPMRMDPAAPMASAPAEPSGDVVVTIAPSAVERAGIVTAAATTGSAPGSLRVPGIVEPNGYRRVIVTPIVGGRVTQVMAELGQHVRLGQTMAQVFSPELAEAETRYISERAGLDAHEQELTRTEALVRIGSASRQELERIHAEHAARQAEVRSAAARLQLLGLSSDVIAGLGADSTIDALVDVPAPIAGVVTERLANTGLNVDPATPLFTVVDLGSVWVVVDVYEQDFSRVRVGTPATVTTAAYPGVSLPGRVSYIDPQVNTETRTAKARIEVANPRGELRLGMYAEAVLAGEDREVLTLVPRTAVQTVADRMVVYLASAQDPGRFVERVVRLGAVTGDRVAVLSGVQPGDLVVAQGSFFVRAERERLGLRQAPPAAERAPATQDARVTVGAKSFEPATVTLRAGVPARITFVRTTDETCATEVVFPSLDIRRALPLNEPVVVEFTPASSGEIAFACGMNMLKGAVVVR